MDKEVLGQPLWLWGLGAVIVVGGYLYFRSHQSSSSSGTPSAGTPGGGGKSSSTSSFKEWITQHQGPPHKKHKKAA